MAEMPLLISWRKPDETVTAMIITRKLTAIEAPASLPLNLRREAMNSETSMIILIPMP